MIHRTDAPRLVVAALLLGACRADHRSVLRDYQAAVNHGDVAAVMALYTDDAEFENVGAWKKKGRAELQQLSEYDAAVGARLEISACKGEGEILECEVSERARWLDLLGLERARIRARFTFRDKQLARLRIEVVPEDAQRVGAALGAAMSWAGQHRPELLGQVISGRTFNYSAKSGRAFLELLAAWKASAAQKKPAPPAGARPDGGGS